MTRKVPNPLDLYEIEQIKVLKASGLSYYAVAKKLGRDHKTVKRCCTDPRNAEEIKNIQRELAGYFEDLSMRLITSISNEDIEKLNAYQRVIAAGISVDKLRLLRNESTSNISMAVIDATIEDLDKSIKESEARLKKVASETEIENTDDVEKVVEIPEPITQT